ncbi:MAG: hypothetical protein H6711_33285 [Myxococcales bacterium]|nr:hypothetical protein [Myxococcales bacterium]
MRRAAPLLAAALALLTARPSEACTPGNTAFTLTGNWPKTDAVDVPIDGVVMALGTGDLFELGPEISVFDGDVEVPGSVGGVESGARLHTWRAAEPFAANTIYKVNISGTTYTFTTGDAPSPEPVASAVGEVTLEQEEVEIRECAQGNGCTCDRWKVVDVETHMRAQVTMPPPADPFGRFNEVEIEVAPGPDQFTGEHRTVALWPSGGQAVSVEFGIAGTWPSDQVCARATVIDPNDRRAVGEASCEPIGEVNTPPEGCACAADPGGGDAALAGLVGLLALASARRRRSAQA